MEKINLKYMRTLDHPLAQRLLENARSGTEVVIEIAPKFFSARDFAKAQQKKYMGRMKRIRYELQQADS
jgi:hypothetical protein